MSNATLHEYDDFSETPHKFTFLLTNPNTLVTGFTMIYLAFHGSLGKSRFI